jgi:hypothetical protein
MIDEEAELTVNGTHFRELNASNNENELLSSLSLKSEIDKATKTYESYLKRSKVIMHNIFALPVYNFARIILFSFFQTKITFN